MLSTDTNA